MAITLPIDDAANEYLTRSPLAPLIGMTLDQQMLEPGRTTEFALKGR